MRTINEIIDQVSEEMGRKEEMATGVLIKEFSERLKEEIRKENTLLLLTGNRALM